MTTKTKASPKEKKKAVIDAILKKRIGSATLIDLALLHGETYMEDIKTALGAINNLVDAQIRDKGSTQNLREQKKVITEILREIDDAEMTSEILNTLLIRLRNSCKE